MSGPGAGATRKAALAASLIFILGLVAGLGVDRLWMARDEVRGTRALTSEAMTAALDLDASEAARVRAVLDTLRVELARAAEAGPDSLGSAARRGRQRLEAALPAERRERFRTWMSEHHARMMGEMRGGMMGPPAAGMGRPGMMDSAGGMMMGPEMMGGDSLGRGAGEGMMRLPDSAGDARRR